MITLYKFGPAFGLPDPSPFVMKVEMLLKMANLLHRTDTTGLAKALKGEIPYINDEGVVVQDSTFIRWHIEKKYRIDFDHGLNASQKAIAWAFEKMAEDQLYWVGMHDRWMVDENFRKGPLRFLNKVPAPIRPILTAIIGRRLRATLHGRDLGQLSSAEIIALATRSVNAIADFLGDKQFFMGSEPTGADATIFAFACVVLCPYFELRIRSAAERRENLRRYVGRMTARYYPGLKELAGCRAAA
jgi:Glutathione S-transferase N-terminal domain/Glutathione S-transferase, C-terminal domain